MKENDYLDCTVPHGIMFHHFYDDNFVKSQGAISAANFENILNYLKKYKCILSAKTWLEKALANKLKKNEICLTFDDALLCQYEIALPVMEAFNLTGFFFVYSGVFLGELERLEIYRQFRTICYSSMDEFYQHFFEKLDSSPYANEVQLALRSFVPENYLSQFIFYTRDDRIFRFLRDKVLGNKHYQVLMEQMIEEKTSVEMLASSLWMTDRHLLHLDKKEHIIGLHSYSHQTALANLPKEEQQQEYEKNNYHLSNLLNKKIVTMSHPCNSYNNDTLEILKTIGIRLGFRSNMHYLEKKGLEYPREDHANIYQLLKEK